MRRRIKELDADRERLDGERVEIEKSVRMRNPVKNLEHEVRKLEFELAERLCQLGERFYGSNVEKTVVNDKVSKTVAAIERNERERKRYEKLFDRVKAGLAIEALGKQKKKLDGEIAGLNKKIEELDKEISKQTVLLGNPATLKMPQKRQTSIQKKETETT